MAFTSLHKSFCYLEGSNLDPFRNIQKLSWGLQGPPRSVGFLLSRKTLGIRQNREERELQVSELMRWGHQLLGLPSLPLRRRTSCGWLHQPGKASILSACSLPDVFPLSFLQRGGENGRGRERRHTCSKFVNPESGPGEIVHIKWALLFSKS